MIEVVTGYPMEVIINKFAMEAKIQKFEKYLQYCKEIGTLTE